MNRGSAATECGIDFQIGSPARDRTEFRRLRIYNPYLLDDGAIKLAHPIRFQRNYLAQHLLQNSRSVTIGHGDYPTFANPEYFVLWWQDSERKVEHRKGFEPSPKHWKCLMLPLNTNGAKLVAAFGFEPNFPT